MISEHTFSHLNEIFLQLDNLVEIQWSTDLEDPEPIDDLEWDMEWDSPDVDDDLFSVAWH